MRFEGNSESSTMHSSFWGSQSYRFQDSRPMIFWRPSPTALVPTERACC